MTAPDTIARVADLASVAWRRSRLGLAVLVLGFRAAGAQTQTDSLATTIQNQDRLFWDAYNRCDVEGMNAFFTPDVEFYHDKGGLTSGVDALAANTKGNLCSNPRSHLRREAIAGSVKVFPLRNGQAIYGAVISGEHRFYVVDSGKPERLDGVAKFFHVWLLKDRSWRMARVISYDHGPPPYVSTRHQAQIPGRVLEQYVGEYRGPTTGAMTIARDQDVLNLKIGDKTFVLYPESDHLFFSKDRDLTFEFVRDEGSKFKLVVRERDTVVEVAPAR